jgi:hypothetical protein
LSNIDLWDDSLGRILTTIYPVDREANANGFRRALGPVSNAPIPAQPNGIAPL